MPNTPGADEQPTQVGPYQIRESIGSGGMGRVYRAHDPRLNRDVALKMLPAEFSSNPQRRARFEQEAKAVAALNHPGIVSVYDVGEGWMVTELVEGSNLRIPGLTIPQIIDIGAQIADALAVAHEAGISHRDLKPENVMLTPDGRTKILDFGLAKVTEQISRPENGKTPEPAEASTLTNPGVPLGSPGYMSPEQVRGQATDQRSDIFSLGVMLYEMLTGHAAFQADSAMEVMHAIVHQELPELPDTVPDGLQRIIKRCLEKKPSQRFQSARDLAFALRSLSTGEITHHAKSAVVTQPASGNRWMWPVLAVFGMLATLGVGYLLQPAPPPGIEDYQFHAFSFSNDQEHSGVWSPDGKSIAFLRQNAEGTHLMVQSLDSPAPTQLVAQINPQPGQLAWSADGTKIYFLANPNGFSLGGVQEVSTAGGLPTSVLNRFGPGRGKGKGPDGQDKGPDAGKADTSKSDPATSDAGKSNDDKSARDAKQLTGRGRLGIPFELLAGKGRGGKQPDFSATNLKGTNGKQLPGAFPQNAQGKQFGNGRPGGLPASTTTAFDVSRDGQTLAVWRAAPVAATTTAVPTAASQETGKDDGKSTEKAGVTPIQAQTPPGGTGKENGKEFQRGGGQNARSSSSATHYSVWISYPIGSELKEYSPAPFATKTVFTPVFLRFSPNGKLLYLSMYTDSGAETWLLPYPAGSGEPRRIFADVAWNKPVDASWMPDSRRMVMSGNPVPTTGEQLWMADVLAQTRKPMLAFPQASQGTPSVSPDGKRLLFARVERNRDIVALPLDGSAPVNLLATNMQEFAPAWSPVGDQFAYVTRRSGTDEIWVRSPEGGWDHPVVTAKEFPNLQALISPVYSPDGSRIAYTALLAGGGRRRSLSISPAGGGTPTFIGDGFAATWSPNAGLMQGASIAFLWLRPDGTLPVATMLIGSDRNPRTLIEATQGLGAPEWSPSGEWLAASSARGVELVSMSPFNPMPPRTLDGLNSAALAWSKDSKTLYGLTFQAAKPTLSSMDVATGKVKQIAEYDLTFQPLLENTVTGSIRLSMSPDGKSVATATSKNQSDLWILDGFEK